MIGTSLIAEMFDSAVLFVTTEGASEVATVLGALVMSISVTILVLWTVVT